VKRCYRILEEGRIKHMEKKPYEAPELIVHGTVAEITLGPSGLIQDVPCGANGIGSPNGGTMVDCSDGFS
jgi:hypothetical protein